MSAVTRPMIGRRSGRPAGRSPRDAPARTRLLGSRPMRLAIDLTVVRQAPFGGTARYAREVFGAMSAAPLPESQLIAVGGWPRWRTNARLRPLQRVANLGLDA